MVNWNQNSTETPDMPPPTTEGWRREIRAAIRSHRISLTKFSEICGIPVGTLARFIKGKKLDKKYKRALGIDHRELHEMPPEDLLWKLKHREDWRGNDRDSSGIHSGD